MAYHSKIEEDRFYMTEIGDVAYLGKSENPFCDTPMLVVYLEGEAVPTIWTEGQFRERIVKQLNEVLSEVTACTTKQWRELRRAKREQVAVDPIEEVAVEPEQSSDA